MDKDVINLAKAISEHESGNNFNAKGASGENGIAQWMPDTWKEHSTKTFGSVQPMTPANQKAVLYTILKQDKDAGLNPAQIAAKWNSGQPDGWENKIGVNKFGVKYDVPAYVKSVTDIYQRNKSVSPKQVEQSQPQPQPTQQPQKAGGFIQQAVDEARNKAEAEPGFLNSLNRFGANVAGGALSSGIQTVSGLNTLAAKIMNTATGTNNYDDKSYDYGLTSEKMGDKFSTGLGSLIPDVASMALAPEVKAPTLLKGLVKVSPKLAESASVVSKSPALGDVVKTFLGKASVAGVNNAAQSVALNTIKTGGDMPTASDVATDFAAGMVGAGLAKGISSRMNLTKASENLSQIKKSSPDYDSFMSNISGNDNAVRDLARLAIKDKSISNLDFDNIIKESSQITDKNLRNKFIVENIFNKSEESMINSFEQLYNKAIETKSGGVQMDRAIGELMQDPSIRTQVLQDGSRKIDFQNSPAVRAYIMANVGQKDASGKIIQRDTIQNINERLNELNSVKELAEKELDKTPEVASMFYPTEKDIIKDVMDNLDVYMTNHGDAIRSFAKRIEGTNNFVTDRDAIMLRLREILTDKIDDNGVIKPSGISSIRKIGSVDSVANLFKDVVRKVSNQKLEAFTNKMQQGQDIKLDPKLAQKLKKTLQELGFDTVKSANNAKILQLATQAQSDLLGAQKIAELMRGQGHDVSKLMSQFMGALGADGFNPIRYHAIKYAADRAQQYVSQAQNDIISKVGKTARTFNDETVGTKLKKVLIKNNPTK